MMFPFDASYYEEFQGRLRGLLIRLEELFEPDQVGLIGELIDANESGVALEMMSDLLVERELRIPHEDADEIALLAGRMRLENVAAAISDLQSSGTSNADSP